MDSYTEDGLWLPSGEWMGETGEGDEEIQSSNYKLVTGIKAQRNSQ